MFVFTQLGNGGMDLHKTGFEVALDIHSLYLFTPKLYDVNS